jgi:hypothetical protein
MSATAVATVKIFGTYTIIDFFKHNNGSSTIFIHNTKDHSVTMTVT